MTNDQTAMLARYGIDYAEAMERFCGNESLFARIAVKYLDDPHVDALEAAMASGDALRADDIEQARALMPDLRESHVAVLEALTNLEEWGLSTSMR